VRAPRDSLYRRTSTAVCRVEEDHQLTPARRERLQPVDFVVAPRRERAAQAHVDPDARRAGCCAP
jgi:hypothetical protein